MDGHPVFVYGTLRQGECRFGILSLVGVLHEQAELKGFDLLSVYGGAFPGLVPGKGTVQGEIHVFKTLAELDRIEGFSQTSPEHSLYLRETVIVSTPEGKMEAITYVFNEDPNTARRSHRRIESGDWLHQNSASTAHPARLSD